MEIELHRKYCKDAYTIGMLYVDGKFVCNTVEDKDRDLENGGKKVYGQTAIPCGRYPVCVSFSPKFRRRLPQVMCVPQFEGIRIHRGNSADDTEGCIIPGKNGIKGGVTNSSYYEQLLTKMIEDAEGRRERIFLNVHR